MTLRTDSTVSPAEHCLPKTPGNHPTSCPNPQPLIHPSNPLVKLQPKCLFRIRFLIQLHIFPLPPSSVFSECPLQLRGSATAGRCCLTLPSCSPLSPSAQPASLLPLCLSQPGLCRAAPCGIRALPRRDPSLTSPCWDAATFPAKHCLPWLYYVCLRRSPASRGRQRRRRETGSQSQDKEKAGR